MTVTQKVTREAAAAATVEEFQKFEHKSITDIEEVEEDDST